MFVSAGTLVYFVFVWLEFLSPAYAAALTIQPDLTNLWLEKGSRLQLDCIYTYPEGDLPLYPDFYYNNIIVYNGERGMTLSASATGINNTRQTSLTLEKNAAQSHDSGTFTCKLQNSEQEVSIQLSVYEVKVTNSLYTGRQIAALKIACDPRDSLSLEKRSQVTVTWYRFGAVTSTNNKYTVNDGNFSLDISNPDKDDIGEYTCELMFDGGIQTVKKMAVIKAAPAIDVHTSNTELSKNDHLDLYCKVSGYPTPAVTWSRNGEIISNSSRVFLQDYQGSPGGRLYITAVALEDAGTYTCHVSSGDFPNDTVSTEIVVKITAHKTNGGKVVVTSLLTVTVVFVMSKFIF